MESLLKKDHLNHLGTCTWAIFFNCIFFKAYDVLCHSKKKMKEGGRTW